MGVVGGGEVWYNREHMITREKKAEAMAKMARSKEDVGSPEVQVAILTERIKEVTEHVKEHKHDFMAKRGLMQMVGQRKKLAHCLYQYGRRNIKNLKIFDWRDCLGASLF